ncbi:MAG: hypothetical protein GX146_08045 [Myxococcales bacterium]|nr:hypothetical protein [Myxococcales bacterium]
MKKKLILLIGALFIMSMGNACDDISDAACGECAKVEDGAFSFVGDARVDGLLKAIGTLDASVGSINANFNADLKELAAAFDVDVKGMGTADMVAAVKGAIQADIAAHASGGLKVKLQKPKCSANVSLAVEASVDCQVKAGCDVDVSCSGPEAKIECEGSCSGGCEGTCEGALPKCELELSAEGKCEGSCSGSCEVKAPSFACNGTCSGTCTAEVSAQCEGTCNGSCDGECSFEDGEGNCAGECEGTCNGTCEVTGSVACEGECNGTCEYEPGEAQCEGTCKGSCEIEVAADAKCEGGKAPRCEAKCTGGCDASCSGTVKPPKCEGSASCEASADCEASASAQASADLTCTPPSLTVDFNFKAGVDAKAKADFVARMEVFKVKMAAIVQGMTKLKALIEGDAELGIDPPVLAIGVQLEAVLKALTKGDLNIDVPIFRINCAIAAFADAGKMLKGLGGKAKATVQGQIDMFALLELN